MKEDELMKRKPILLRVLKPFGYYDDHEIGEIISVVDHIDVTFLVFHGYAEFVEEESK